MNRIFFIAMLCVLVVSSASAKPKDNDKTPATATVAVDCNRGQSITKALNQPAAELTIEISGICEEYVEILRHNVTLQGTDPLMDGIRPAPGGPTWQVITVFGVHGINIENLSLTGADIGIGINASFGIFVNNCLIETHKYGLIAGTGSRLKVLDTEMAVTASSVDARTGIWLTNASNLICTSCTIENRDAIQMQNGSQMYLYDSRALGTRYGVRASEGSHFRSPKFVSEDPSTMNQSTIEGISQAAISLTGNASAYIVNDHISGEIRLWEKSVATLRDAYQVNSLTNYVHSGSSLVASGLTSLDGDLKIREFSDVTLQLGSTVSGGLSCERGGDAFCDDPLGVTSWSDCDQCPIPGSP